MITVTPAAVEQIRSAAVESGAEELVLRVAAQRLPDGTLDYGMGFDEPREQDAALEIDGVSIAIGAPSRDLLAGTVLDFVEFAPGDFRFIFIPPGTAASEPYPASGEGRCGNCGCGRADAARALASPLKRTLLVGGRAIETDSEGYLLDLGQWSEDFARAQARAEGLTLTPAHWEVIHFLREYFERHGVQAQVRVMIRHFTERWGAERGSNHALHDMFPRGGPQKQGNRLAGLLRTKGEH